MLKPLGHRCTLPSDILLVLMVLRLYRMSQSGKMIISINGIYCEETIVLDTY